MLSNCLNTWESIRQESFAKDDTSPTSSSLICRCDQYIANMLPPLSPLRYRSSLPTVKSKSEDLRPANSLCQRLHGIPSVEDNMSIIHDIMKTFVRTRVSSTLWCRQQRFWQEDASWSLSGFFHNFSIPLLWPACSRGWNIWTIRWKRRENYKYFLRHLTKAVPACE